MTRCKAPMIVACGLIAAAALFFTPSTAQAGGYFVTGGYAPVYYAPPPVYYAPPIVYSYPAYPYGYAYSPVVCGGGGYYGPAFYPGYRRGFGFGFGFGYGYGGRGWCRPYWGGGRYWCR